MKWSNVVNPWCRTRITYFRACQTVLLCIVGNTLLKEITLPGICSRGDLCNCLLKIFNNAFYIMDTGRWAWCQSVVNHWMSHDVAPGHQQTKLLLVMPCSSASTTKLRDLNALVASSIPSYGFLCEEEVKWELPPVGSDTTFSPSQVLIVLTNWALYQVGFPTILLVGLLYPMGPVHIF